MRMPIRLSRRGAITGLGASLALLRTRMAGAAEPDLVRVSLVPIFDVAPLYAANAQGYFHAEGIEITIQAIQGGVVGIPGLVAGAYDVTYANSISTVLALARGIDIRIIGVGAPIEDHPPDPVGLLKRKGDPSRTGKDFEGRSIAINARRDIQWLVVREWVKATGGEPDKVDYREVPIPQALDALRSKQVDAALVLDPFLTVGLGGQEFELLAWPFQVVLPGMRPAFWVVTGATADKKSELVTRFVHALRKGVRWVNENAGKSAYLELVSGYTRIDPDLVRRIHVPPELDSVDLGPIDRVVALMRENGLLDIEVDVKAKVFNAT
jgi:NitT/TauT family transport system substrate-binding protein